MDYCRFGYDPCKNDFHGFGTPAFLYGCDQGEQSMEVLCPQFDFCADILTEPQRGKFEVTDFRWRICPQVVSDPKIYKYDLPKSVPRLFDACN